jgi:hypothetical protein
MLLSDICGPNYSFGMTPEQCRASRGWLNWTQVELAEKAKVGLSTVIEFEHGYRDTSTANRIAIQTALERRRIRFLNGAGPLDVIFEKPSRRNGVSRGEGSRPQTE